MPPPLAAGGGGPGGGGRGRAKNPYAPKKKNWKSGVNNKPPVSGTGSDNNNNNGNKNSTKLKKNGNTSGRGCTSSAFGSSAGGPLPPMQAFTGSSFSQAFGSIEDTEYYRQSTCATADNHYEATASDEIGEADRAEQRAIFNNEISNNDEEARRIADRDHHVMIQPHVLSVSLKQKGNGVLNFIRNVPFSYTRMVPDYVLSTTTCALFLSCKYHSLHPGYIHKRIAELKTDFKIRILLVLVDLEDNAATLLYLNKLAVQQNLTMILSWTEEECARYLETYKALKDNDASLIQRKEKTNFVDQATELLSAAKVNKNDSGSLLTQFGSIKAIMAASTDELALISGMGQVKVRRLHDAFHKPFSTMRKRERRQEQEQLTAADSKLAATSAKNTTETKTTRASGNENDDNAINKPPKEHGKEKEPQETEIIQCLTPTVGSSC